MPVWIKFLAEIEFEMLQPPSNNARGLSPVILVIEVPLQCVCVDGVQGCGHVCVPQTFKYDEGSYRAILKRLIQQDKITCYQYSYFWILCLSFDIRAKRVLTSLGRNKEFQISNSVTEATRNQNAAEAVINPIGSSLLIFTINPIFPSRLWL